MTKLLICPDSVPNFLGFLDLSIAPHLLYYSYVPIMFLSLFFGIVIFKKDNHSIRSKVLLAMAISFFLLLANEIVQWTAIHASVVLFGWQTVSFYRILICLLTPYFLYVYFFKKDLPFQWKILLSSVYIGILSIIPTTSNVSGFDLTNCEGIPGSLWTPMLFFEVLFSLIAVILISILKLRLVDSKNEKKQSWILAVGSTIFLAIFFISSAYGDLTTVYEVSLLGPLGMVVFLGLLSYMIVKFRAFNIKLLGAQALVYSLIILIGSQFFFIRNQVNMILTGITELLTIIFGYYLILGVKREIEQREEIERLATSLARSNDQLTVANDKLKELDKQKTEFVSLASHQLRSPLTAIKGYSSMILEGSFGKINEKAKEAIGRVFESSQKLVLVIEDFLNVTRIELGRMKYDVTEFSFNKLVSNVIGEQKPNVERRGLTISYEEDAPEYKVFGDMGKISQVISNLVDNSVKYCKEGSITVKIAGLEDGGKKKVRLSITDTGVGIEPQVLPHLFQKFVRAYDAGKTNIIGTGLGLFVAKQMIDAHPGGKIWAESEGKNKGSTFFVELEVSTGTAPIMITPPADASSSDVAKPADPAVAQTTSSSPTPAEAPIPQPTAGDLS